MRKFFAAAVFFLLFAFSSAPLRAGDDSSSGDRTIYFNDFISKQKDVVKNIQERLDAYSQRIDEFVNAHRERMKELGLRLHQTYFILLVNIDNPYEFRTAHREVMRSADNILREMKVMEDQEHRLARDLFLVEEILSVLRPMREAQLSPEVQKDIEYIIQRAEIIRFSLIDFYFTLDHAAIDSEKTEREAVRIIDLNRKYAYKQVISFIINPVGRMFDINTLVDAYPNFMEWIATLSFVILEKVPDTLVEWMFLIFVTLAGGILLTIGGFRLIRALPDVIPPDSGAVKYIKRAVVFLAFGAPLFFTELRLDFPETLLTYWTGMVLIAAAGVCFSWGVRKIRHQTDAPPPLRPLLALYILGIICQALNMELTLLAYVWAPAMAVSTAVLLFKLRENYPKSDKIIFWLSAALGIILFSICVYGYVCLALFIQLLWFTLMLGLRTGSAAAFLLRETVRNRQSKISSFWRIIITDTFVPLVWMAIVGGVIFFAFDQIGEVTLAMDILNTDISVGEISFKSMNIAAIIFLFIVFRLILHLINSSLNRIAELSSIERNMVPSVQTLVFYAVWTIYAIVALQLVGIKFTTLLVVLGGLSVGIGFGLQNIVNNFVSGLIILFSRSLHQGDIIQLGSNLGVVEKINMRSTVMLTFDNASIVIPNTTLLTADLTNWTRNDMSVRQDIPLTSNYAVSFDTLKGLLTGIAARIPGVISSGDKKPELLLSELGDSAMKLILRVWVEDIRMSPRTLSEIRNQITVAFKENDISFK